MTNVQVAVAWLASDAGGAVVKGLFYWQTIAVGVVGWAILWGACLRAAERRRLAEADAFVVFGGEDAGQ